MEYEWVEYPCHGRTERSWWFPVPSSRLYRDKEAGLAKNNYGFQKRSRELAKKKKKEEKRLRKQQARTGPEAGPETEGVVDESQAVENAGRGR